MVRVAAYESTGTARMYILREVKSANEMEKKRIYREQEWYNARERDKKWEREGEGGREVNERASNR